MFDLLQRKITTYTVIILTYNYLVSKAEITFKKRYVGIYCMTLDMDNLETLLFTSGIKTWEEKLDLKSDICGST
jgi:hypothetical protein